MAESEKNCVACGCPIPMFSRMTIDGVAYHAHCWHYGDRPVPKVRPATRPEQAHPSEGGDYAMSFGGNTEDTAAPERPTEQDFGNGRGGRGGRDDW